MEHVPIPIWTELPTELLVHVLTLAATSSRRSALALAQVAHWTRNLVLPIVWSVIVIRPGPTNHAYGLDWAPRFHSACGVDESEDIIVGSKARDGIPYRLIGLYTDSMFCSILHSQFSEIGACIAPQIVAPALPRLRRLASSISVLCDALHAYSGVEASEGGTGILTPPLLQELTLDASRSSRAGVLPIYDPFVVLRASPFFVLKGLTHLHLGQFSITTPANYEVLFVDLFPALSHFALEFSTFNAAMEVSALLDWALQHPGLDSLVIIERVDYLTYKEARAYSNILDSGTVAEAEQFVKQKEDSRLRVLILRNNFLDDWILWEKLAHENRNIWDLVAPI